MSVRRVAAHLPTILLLAVILLGSAGVVDRFTLDVVFLLYCAWTVLRLIGGSDGSRSLLVAAAAGFGLLAAARLQFPHLQYLPYLAIAPANLVLAYVFGRGLFGDREPVLIQLVNVMGLKTADDPAFRRFVVRQCLLWCLMTLAMALVALVCVVAADARPLLSSVLGALAIAQVIHFALSHQWAAYRYGRPETWMLTLRTMIRPETWRGLKV